MAERLTVTARDIRRLLDLTDLARLEDPGRPLPDSLLAGLRHLIGCDLVMYESHDVAGHVVVHHQHNGDAPPLAGYFAHEEVQQSFWGLYRRGLADYWPRTGDYAKPRRMLLEPQWRDWQRTAYAEYVRGNRTRGEITVALPAHFGLEHRILFWRYSGREFTERDCLLLTLLHPRLVSLHEHALRRGAGIADLTPRQWEIMRLIAGGYTNRQIATQLEMSEGTVRTHCQNIFGRLNVNSRVAAISRAFP